MASDLRLLTNGIVDEIFRQSANLQIVTDREFPPVFADCLRRLIAMMRKYSGCYDQWRTELTSGTTTAAFANPSGGDSLRAPAGKIANFVAGLCISSFGNGALSGFAAARLMFDAIIGRIQFASRKDMVVHIYFRLMDAIQTAAAACITPAAIGQIYAYFGKPDSILCMLSVDTYADVRYMCEFTCQCAINPCVTVVEYPRKGGDPAMSLLADTTYKEWIASHPISITGNVTITCIAYCA